MGKDPPYNNKSHGVNFGPWEEVEILEFDYDKHLEEYEEKRRIEEHEREMRLKRADRMEKSWEMLRISKKYIKENSPHWEQNREQRERDQKRKERLEKVGAKKAVEKEKLIQRKITEAITRLPDIEKKRMLEEEEKEKRLELKEIKENVWKKWRGKGEKKDKRLENPKSRKELMELRLERIENALTRVKEDEENRKKQAIREAERREKYIKEKRISENNRIVEEKKRREKKQRKELLEKHWAMLRWITEFIDENKLEWENNIKDRKEKVRALEESERWDRLKAGEKERELKEISELEQNNHLTRDEKIALAKKKRKMWTNWRKPNGGEGDPDMDKDPPSIKKSLDGDRKKTNMGGGEGDPVLGKDPPYPKKSIADNENGQKACQRTTGGEGDPEMGKDPPCPKKSLEENTPSRLKKHTIHFRQNEPKILFLKRMDKTYFKIVKLGDILEEPECNFKPTRSPSNVTVSTTTANPPPTPPKVENSPGYSSNAGQPKGPAWGELRYLGSDESRGTTISNVGQCPELKTACESRSPHPLKPPPEVTISLIM